MQRRKPLANRQVIDLFDRRRRSFLIRFRSGEVGEKLLEIDAVVAKGVRTYVALITQVFEELLDKLLHKKSGGGAAGRSRFDLSLVRTPAPTCCRCSCHLPFSRRPGPGRIISLS